MLRRRAISERLRRCGKAEARLTFAQGAAEVARKDRAAVEGGAATGIFERRRSAGATWIARFTRKHIAIPLNLRGARAPAHEGRDRQESG
ncbi:hypothetical protein B1812_17395 [Methylocystis bryophila]|uniref:Uncharacterized protein n=1 Tax=Methylocystis bryophila TaxID=655015 RepID=A0A1W6MYF4_9HYPH|nr:hypothetical protein B1812_17395 [Methylocystis bryophila]